MLSALLAKVRWTQRHLLGIRDLSRDEILAVLSVASALKQEKDLGAPLKGRRLLAFFSEASTRTKLSFGIAARALGLEVIDLSPSGSSLTKGETLKDTALTIESMGVRFAVVRHSASGAPHFISRTVRGAVINAGDGANEHPSQALLDLLTMQEALGRTSGLKIALVGDITHSRVARSNLWAHAKLGNEVTLVGPPTLVPREAAALGARITYDLDAVLPEADVVMMLRLQLERQQAGLFPSTMEYHRFWGLTRERFARLKKGAIVMHPGPMNRGLEISAEAADSDRSVILQQVANGVFVRMAVLLLLDQAR
ncbi:MAG: aspartate carbamoyltransferase catalytic subunit [Planctomycetes bacterium]|nr:aspartate carbamoyltransferase catalytic subunit [Planctomycetota bacterium]